MSSPNEDGPPEVFSTSLTDVMCIALAGQIILFVLLNKPPQQIEQPAPSLHIQATAVGFPRLSESRVHAADSAADYASSFSFQSSSALLDIRALRWDENSLPQITDLPNGSGKVTTLFESGWIDRHWKSSLNITVDELKGTLCFVTQLSPNWNSPRLFPLRFEISSINSLDTHWIIYKHWDQSYRLADYNTQHSYGNTILGEIVNSLPRMTQIPPRSRNRQDWQTLKSALFNTKKLHLVRGDLRTAPQVVIRLHKNGKADGPYFLPGALYNNTWRDRICGYLATCYTGYTPQK